eukprot:2954067-Rhodomonas_salina.1
MNNKVARHSLLSYTLKSHTRTYSTTLSYTLKSNTRTHSNALLPYTPKSNTRNHQIPKSNTSNHYSVQILPVLGLALIVLGLCYAMPGTDVTYGPARTISETEGARAADRNEGANRERKWGERKGKKRTERGQAMGR